MKVSDGEKGGLWVDGKWEIRESVPGNEPSVESAESPEEPTVIEPEPPFDFEDPVVKLLKEQIERMERQHREDMERTIAHSADAVRRFREHAEELNQARRSPSMKLSIQYESYRSPEVETAWATALGPILQGALAKLASGEFSYTNDDDDPFTGIYDFKPKARTQGPTVVPRRSHAPAWFSGRDADRIETAHGTHLATRVAEALVSAFNDRAEDLDVAEIWKFLEIYGLMTRYPELAPYIGSAKDRLVDAGASEALVYKVLGLLERIPGAQIQTS